MCLARERRDDVEASVRRLGASIRRHRILPRPVAGRERDRIMVELQPLVRARASSINGVAFMAHRTPVRSVQSRVQRIRSMGELRPGAPRFRCCTRLTYMRARDRRCVSR
jgi:hypothetical protein